MNWTKAVVAGVVAGIVLWLVDFVLHVQIMGATYKKYPVFTQTEASMWSFLLVSICVGIFIAVLFAKTRGSWGGGVSGGVTFGLFFGLALFFGNFYWPLVLEGFPYYLGWCWGGIGLIDTVVAGAVIALIYKNG